MSTDQKATIMRTASAAGVSTTQEPTAQNTAPQLPKTAGVTNHKVPGIWAAQDGTEYKVNYMFSGHETADGQFKIVSVSGGVIGRQDGQKADRIAASQEFRATLPPITANLQNLPEVNLGKLKAGHIKVEKSHDGTYQTVDSSATKAPVAPAAVKPPAAESPASPELQPVESEPKTGKPQNDEIEEISYVEYLAHRLAKQDEAGKLVIPTGEERTKLEQLLETLTSTGPKAPAAATPEPTHGGDILLKLEDDDSLALQ